MPSAYPLLAIAEHPKGRSVITTEEISPPPMVEEVRDELKKVKKSNKNFRAKRLANSKIFTIFRA